VKQHTQSVDPNSPGIPPKFRPGLMLAALIFGGCLSLALLLVLFGGEKTDFEEASAFGAQTTSVYASIEGHPIHCSGGHDANHCIAGARARKAQRSVLWLGNSQVHAVNQWEKGQTNAAPILFEALNTHDLDLLTFSQPNANLQEQYVLFEYLIKQLPIRALILPVVFDDLREEGLREDIASLAHDTTSALSKTKIGRKLLATTQGTGQNEDTAGIRQTIQERTEKSLNSWLSSNSRLWEARPEMRGKLFTNLYLARNSLLGIKATSKRKIIRGRYTANLSALEEILITAKANDIRVVLYIVPLRNDVETPYVQDEYNHFKSNLETLATKFGSRYANLENLVPAKLWGVKAATGLGKESEIDFMHFQSEGHQLLAHKLKQLVIEILPSSRVKP
jgi:hypothetical protein